MFETKDLNISVNGRYLVKDLNLTLNKKDKLAIIGEEGNGKSTLLKSILGICDYATISGSIDLKNNRIGYLEQSINKKDLEKTGYDFLFENDEKYYEKVNELYKYLDKINLKEDVIEQRINTLSGGEKVKIRILKLLLDESDLLFLDEPTNDLDIKTLEWLEDFINQTDKPIMYVSHDETLLANTANMILHLEQINNKTDCRNTLLTIDYDTYVEQRIRKIQKQTQVAKFEKKEHEKSLEKYRKVMQRVEYLQETITRQDPHGAALLKKKMHALKAQERKLDNKDLTQIPYVEESIKVLFENIQIPKNKKIVGIEIPELKIGDKTLCKNIKLDIIGNTHMCILGENGVGKTTLIKKIYEELTIKNEFKIGYMPQMYDDVLSKYENVLDFVAPSRTKDDITKARTYLGSLNFTKDEMTGEIEDLSNGSKAKLFLAKFMLEGCNVLILDEPTRNVSPLSNPVIREALSEYSGTIISISHDRKYIKEVANKVYTLTPNGLI